MSREIDWSLSNDACCRLIDDLISSFPRKKDIDYFVLCKLDRECTFVPADATEMFEHLSALLSTLRSLKLIEADYFVDGRQTFFWNVVFTSDGYMHAKRVLTGWQSSDREQALFLDLCRLGPIATSFEVGHP